MRLNYDVPMPITFNCWKHHLQFVKEQIKNQAVAGASEQDLKKVLLVIGESQMDLYLGNLSPLEISIEIINKLNQKKLSDKKNYTNWLSQSTKHYNLIAISDGSVWTLRLGQDEKRYVHIHPGRQSPLTIRVKAHTLKTAIVVAVQAQKMNTTLTQLSFINDVRKSFLNLPPLKSISSLTGLGKFMNILNT